MTTTLKKAEDERVVHVDFPGSRRGAPPDPARLGGRTATVTTALPRGRRTVAPGPGSIGAVAHLIAEKADPDTVQGDLEVICTLLQRNCRWNEESLITLRRSVAAVLEQAQPVPSGGGTAAACARLAGSRHARAVSLPDRD